MSGHLETSATQEVVPLAVQESGRALKVRADTPHLVSLGGGRLSTAVTLHPIPNGRVTLGSAKHADILIQGTGVEPIHCHIENINGVVTLYPRASAISIDGLTVVSPTRLVQGVMITIGRSNYLRFNHPAEAQLMKAVLPNQRISMGPIQFYPANETNDQYTNVPTHSYRNKPPVAPKKSPRDSWSDSAPEENSILSKVSKFEMFATQHLRKSVSPKVFSSDLVTVNTPAKDVLGKSPTNIYNYTKNLQQSAVNYSENSCEKNHKKNSNIRVVIHENGCIPKLNQNGYVNVSINDQMSQSMYATSTPLSVKLPVLNRNVCGSNPNLNDNIPNNNTLNNSVYTNENRITTPSPSFNRNPTYRNGASNLHSKYEVKRKSGSLNELFKTIDNSIRTITNSIEDLTQRKNQAEDQRNKALEERLREQEAEKAEQVRLEEILNMCAEYEKQIQNEKVYSKPVPTPNRIKTNGSLPRDKRSPAAQNIDDTVFKFDSDVLNLQQTKNNWCSRNNLTTYENISLNKFPNNENTNHKYENFDSQKTFSPYENVIVSNQQVSYHPQSPRTRIKTYVTANKPEVNIICKRDLNEAYENIEHKTNGTKADMNNSHCQESTIIPTNGIAKNLSDHFMNDNLVQELTNLKAAINQREMNTSTNNSTPHRDENCEISENVLKEKNVNEMSETNNELIANEKQIADKNKNKKVEKLISQRSQIRESIRNITFKIRNLEAQEDELLTDFDFEKSLISGELTSEMNALKELEKGKVALQEQAKNMEQTMQNCRVQQEQDQQDIRKKLENALDNVDKIQNKILECDKTSDEYNALHEELEKAQELLENERKAFEDLEFRSLEEEANMLATREELQREIQDLSHTIETKKEQMLNLETQQNEICINFNQESKRLERQLIVYLRNLEEYKSKIKMIECELETLTDVQFNNCSDSDMLSDDDSDSQKLQSKIKSLKNQHGKENIQRKHLLDQHKHSKSSQALNESMSQSFHCGSNESQKKIDLMSQSFNEMLLNKSNSDISKINYLSPENLTLSLNDNFINDSVSNFGKLSKECKSPSQDDIDRISKVTSDAPIDLGDNTGSLGRKTIESLKEIERVRQIHLVQQGSHVIEEERKRVSELKRRVQDEVRAQWEERRQRECNSLNSVGSEDSVLTSSEGNSGIARESIAESENEEKEKQSRDSKNLDEEQRRHSQVDSIVDSTDERRPLSESSDLSYDTQISSVKTRPKRSPSSPQQRPLTRYLPIRNDSLNLKQHIESAGHQVDLCPHVILDSTTCRGYLNKMGSRFHSWNKRWFVFDRVKRILVYYSDKHEKKPRGCARFQAIEEVYLDHLNSVKSPNPQLTFIMKTYERSYHLMAPSPEAMRIWIDVIFTGAEGYQEFAHGT